MKIKGVKNEFEATPWQYASPRGWTFVALPEELSAEIRNFLKLEEGGWGRLKATAQIGKSEWKTAIWFDRKMNCYLLPLKAEIKKKENIAIGVITNVIVWI